MKLFKSGDNAIVEFKEKEKTVEALEEFLESNCKVRVGQSNSLRDRQGKQKFPADEKHKAMLRDEL